jgi:hypothetical protein
VHNVTSDDDTFEDLNIPTTNQLQFVQPITQSITQSITQPQYKTKKQTKVHYPSNIDIFANTLSEPAVTIGLQQVTQNTPHSSLGPSPKHHQQRS